jgi:prepilin-type N-terminal cleavage/methylation domain-containing protein
MIFKIHSNQSGFTLIEIIATVVIVSVFSAMMLTLFTDSLIKSSDSFKRISKSSDLSNVMANIMADYTPYPKWKASTAYSAANKVLPTGMNGRFYICTSSGTSGTSEPQWRDYGETQDGGARWKAGIWVKQTAYAAGDMVIPTNPNGHFYRCTTGGASGLAEPAELSQTHPTGYVAISDGAVTWKRLLGYLQLQIGTADANLKDNSYGKYYVVLNRFVKFVSNTIQPIGSGEPENVLQVTIKSVERNADGTYRQGDMTLTALFTAKEN